MRRLEEFEAAEFHEWDVAACEFDLEGRAVARRAEQNCLRFQTLTGFSIGEDGFDDLTGLRVVISDVDERGQVGRCAIGPEVLGKAFRG
jgi:hypothetical protein